MLLNNTKKNKLLSVLLTVIMLFSIWSVPFGVSASEMISVKNSEITTDTQSVTVNLESLPSSGILRIVQMDENESYSSDKLNEYTSLYFSVVSSLTAGDNNLTLNAKPTAGKKIVAVLRDSSLSDNQDYVSKTFIVKDAKSESAGGDSDKGETVSKSEEEILKNCSVQIMENGEAKTENFKEDDNLAYVKVKLDDSVESCYMNIYAYAGNTAFDPDSSYNIRLWSGEVTDNYSGECNFSSDKLPLKKGYKIVASLNVPVGDDNYKPVNSQSIEVVDENGEGFEDYVYPDVTIDETELKDGDTSLHISLTGDERIFKAAQEKKTSITCAVAQYPDGEEFDLESDKQISLASNISCTEAFSGKEVKLSEPLKEGYRVRAVVYWAQNEDIFLPKGNDYEAMFSRPDDSVLVASKPEATEPSAVITSPVNENAENIEITLGGNIPQDSIILVKSYENSAEKFETDQGTPVGVVNAVKGKNILTANENSFKAKDKLVAFILNQGETVAQSEPVTVEQIKDFTVTLEGILTENVSEVSFRAVANDSNILNINVAGLYKTGADGSADMTKAVAVKYGQASGLITFTDIGSGALKAGDKVCLVLKYDNGNKTFESEPFSVSAQLKEDSLAIQETEVDTETSSITVNVKGCDDFKGGLLILTIGKPSTNDDADSRTQLGSKRFTGAGAYTFDIDPSKLKEGQTIKPHLYLYGEDDISGEFTLYKYGNALDITAKGGAVKESKLEIATDTIQADREDVWIIADFDSSFTADLKLYTYEGETFLEDTAEEIYSKAVSPGEDSRKITFGKDKLEAGKKLVAVLDLSDGTRLLSEPKVIQAASEKQKPEVRILDKAITAGDTQMKASMKFDEDAENVSYVLYQFKGESLDKDTAQIISKGTLYRNETNKVIYIGQNKLEVGANLQIILTADGQEAKSGILTVEPSPDWGTPYAAFDVSAVKEDADSIPVTVDYCDEYLSLGDEFYCDITVYQFSAQYTDQEFEDKELWENTNFAKRVAQANSTKGDITKGQIKVPVIDGAELNPGDRLIIKLRLPHTEWDGEEVDYIFASVPVVGADEEIPNYKVVLYNLSEDSSRGERLRSILKDLGISAEEITDKDLNETVGYLAGLEGYEQAKEDYEGSGSDEEFMLMCNLPESLLDRFLEMMMENGLRINHKAVVTEYNKDYEFHELVDDIGGEHDVFQALLDLDDLISEAEKLSEDKFGNEPSWKDFSKALRSALNIISSDEPALSDLEAAYENLKNKYIEITGMEEIKGSVIISINADEKGSYTMTAELFDESNNVISDGYKFIWSDGTEGKTIKNISAEKIIAMRVSVTRDDMFGEIKASLQVPDMPKAKAESDESSIKISWDSPEEENNKPLPTEYRAVVYDKNGNTVKDAKCQGTSTSLSIDGLDENCQYIVKLCAVSPVGRSDMKVMSASTVSDEGGKDEDNDSKPGISEDKTQDSGRNDKENSKDSSANKTSPKTGDDNTDLMMLLILVFISLGGTITASVYKRKYK